MHRPRLIGWKDSNVYHVISRTAGQDYLFGPVEREVFGKMLVKVGAFCGVEVLTWCCLSNHFHLLVRINNSDADRLRIRLRGDSAAFLKHMAILYKGRELRELRDEMEQLLAGGHDVALAELADRYLSRIGDLSIFVKELKQRFSIWYNDHHQRIGTLWSARFRSVLVENSPRAVRTVACYIDLNPVRAGLVEDPKDYRWCGYGQALGGNVRARKGLRAVIDQQGRGGDAKKPVLSWRNAALEYRVVLFGKAVALRGNNICATRKGASAGAVAEVLLREGKLPLHELFRLRVRHLTAGTALGSAEFLQSLIEERPEQVSAKRSSAARPIRGLAVEDLHSLRDLRG